MGFNAQQTGTVIGGRWRRRRRSCGIPDVSSHSVHKTKLTDRLNLETSHHHFFSFVLRFDCCGVDVGDDGGSGFSQLANFLLSPSVLPCLFSPCVPINTACFFPPELPEKALSCLSPGLKTRLRHTRANGYHTRTRRGARHWANPHWETAVCVFFSPKGKCNKTALAHGKCNTSTLTHRKCNTATLTRVTRKAFVMLEVVQVC